LTRGSECQDAGVVPHRTVDVDGVPVAVRESGSGDPVVFLHGNPTSSVLWRDVVPALEPFGRCIVPDLVGMGESARLPGAGDDRYRFVEHRRHLAGLLEALGVRRRAVLVGHDWGGVLLTDWARHHPDAVRGIVIMESLVAPVRGDSSNAPEPSIFGPLRSPAGERLVLEENLLVETVLQGGTMRTLAPAELDAYRAPFREPGEGRRAMLTWAREIPIDGVPADVHAIVAANADWMASSPVPKLLISGEPGALLTGPLLELARSWPVVTEAVVRGLHFLPEDSPDGIAAAITRWMGALPGDPA
jgi:haloalkane dehalogenase